MAKECRLPTPETVMKFLETESRLSVFTLDERGVILNSNGGMERLFGLNAPQTGRNIMHFVLPENEGRVKRIIEALSLASPSPVPSFRKETINFRFSGSAVHTMACFFSRCEDAIALIAEPRRMSDSEVMISMTDLNNELAGLSRELTRKNVELEKANETIGRLLNTDVLTGIPNRRALEKFLAERSGREVDQPFSLVMADIDYFKKVNDSFGHQAGDMVLAAFGKILAEQTRERDVPGRYGGEEFMIVMPRTAIKEAIMVAERIRVTTEMSPIEDPLVRVTASFGVVCANQDEEWQALIRRADRAMYQAKESGRNKVFSEG